MSFAKDTYIRTVRALIEENELSEAMRVLYELDEQVKAGIGNDVRMQSAKLKEADKMFKIDGVIELKDYKMTTAQVRSALFAILDDLPERLRLNDRVRSLDAGLAVEVPEDDVLEKVLGEKSNILRINWLEKALKASKAVCRVVCDNGEVGTGFITREGYLFTNNHVLPDADTAANARVEFNYELDANGVAKNQIAYRLDATDFETSPSKELDFTRVRIVDRPEQPLKQWGFLEFETQKLPQAGDPVTIIQHPNGLDKHIALSANEVLSVWNQHLFYTTDTEPGSSGSPVFNKDWKVVALHHAGKGLQQGGLQINERGDKHAANRGILFRKIWEKLGLQQPQPGAAKANTTANMPEPAGDTEESANPARPKPNAQPAVDPKPKQPEARPEPSGPPSFLFVYDLADEEAAKSLKKHLNISILTKKLKAHFVHQVPAGQEPLSVAQSEMPNSHYVVALISVNLFNAPDWFSLIVEAMEQGKSVIPVRLDAVDLEGTGLEKRRSLPSKNRTVSDFSNSNAAYLDIVEGLKQLKP